MQVLGISGSPKANGLTGLLLDKVLEGARASGAHTEKIILNDLNFRACQECGGCGETGICILDDDMRPIYEKLAKADAVVVASPVYFGNITAQLKAMIDRCHSSWVAKEKWGNPKKGDTHFFVNKTLHKNGCPLFYKKRKGIFLCVAGRKSKEYFENAKKTIKIFFVTQNIEYLSDIFISGLNTMSADDPKRETALEEAFHVGANIASI